MQKENDKAARDTDVSDRSDALSKKFRHTKTAALTFTAATALITLTVLVLCCFSIATREKEGPRVIYNQMNPAVSAFLDNTEYSPDDYSTSAVCGYAAVDTVYSKSKPLGAKIEVGDGILELSGIVPDGTLTEESRSGVKEIYNVVYPGTVARYRFTESQTKIYVGDIVSVGKLRMINSAEADNIRDLGGWPCDGGTVKYGKLFRGSAVSKEDAPVLVGQLGIVHDFDLRGTEGNNGLTSSPLGDSVRYHVYDRCAWYSISDHELVADILTDIIDAVLQDEPVYFHCQMGADRTGTVAMLLEALLGMSQSDIDKDYELTTFFSGYETEKDMRCRNERDWQHLIGRIGQYPGDCLRDKAVTYAVSIGIPAEKINAYRRAMTDGEPEEVTDILTYLEKITQRIDRQTDNFRAHSDGDGEGESEGE